MQGAGGREPPGNFVPSPIPSMICPSTGAGDDLTLRCRQPALLEVVPLPCAFHVRLSLVPGLIVSLWIRLSTGGVRLE